MEKQRFSGLFFPSADFSAVWPSSVGLQTCRKYHAGAILPQKPAISHFYVKYQGCYVKYFV